MTSQAWQQQLDGAQQKAHIFAYKKDNRKKGGRKAHAPQAWCLLDPETNTQEKFNALDDSERADLKKKFKTTQHAARAPRAHDHRGHRRRCIERVVHCQRRRCIERVAHWRVG